MKNDMYAPIDAVLIYALDEDIGSGDVTTAALIADDHFSEARIIAKGDIVLAGLPFAERVFQLVDKTVKFKTLKGEGSRVRQGSIVAKIKGRTKGLLIAERTALNVLQRVSGIATLTNEYVRVVRGLKTRITDTRKTAPGLRYFDRYGVRTGGGRNHRYGLYDGVLIKDNHIAAAGGVGKAVARARSNVHHLLKVEVEVSTLSGAQEAVKAGADVIMLDNMQVERIKKAVQIIRDRSPDTTIEASGTLHLGNVREVAETGVDVISIGALTHSAPAADLSMEFSSS